MRSNVPHRKVLIIEDDPSIRNVLYMVLAGMGVAGEIAHSDDQVLANLQRDKFDAVLLDLRCAGVKPEEVVPAIHRLQPELVGRVLVITGEVVDARTMDLVEEHFLLQVRAENRAEDIARMLRAVLTLAPSPKRAA